MQVVGPYRLVEEVARGGMGAVFRAQGPAGEDVALKVLHLEHPRARQRFLGEARALSRLQHPNVVPILDSGEHQGNPWLALAFVDGQSLEQRLRFGRLPVHEAIRIAQQLTQALAYVHSCGMLHRNVKPANVLLRGEQALLTDFGLVLDDQSSLSRITATGVFLGTPGYWAPEQAHGAKDELGPHTDVYGLGALLYACLTGRPPVQAATLRDFLAASGSGESAVPPRRERPEVPAWLSELCMRCLATDPAKRPTNAEEVGRALLLAGGGRRAEPPPSLGLLVGLAVGLVLAGLVALLGVARGDGSATASASAPPPAPLEPEVPAPVPVEADPTESDGFAEDELTEAQQARLQELLDAAQGAIGAGEFERASESLDEIHELNPRSSRVWEGRGVIHAYRGELEEALADFERALEAEPKRASTWMNRGIARMNLLRYEEAIADLDQALALNPEIAQALSARGMSKAGLGRHADALEDYGAVLRDLPNDVRTLGSRAESLYALGRYEAAAADYSRILELRPGDAQAWTDRGFVRQAAGQHEAAIADFEQAIGMVPAFPNPYAGRATSRLQLERFAEALEDCERVSALGVPPEFTDSLAETRAAAEAGLSER